MSTKKNRGDGWKQELVAIIQRNVREELRVQVVRSPTGWWGAGIRVFYQGREDGEMHAGREGVVIAPNLLGDVISALQDAKGWLRDEGLIDKAHAGGGVASSDAQPMQQRNATQPQSFGRRKLDPEDIQKAIEMHCKGFGLAQIGNVLAVDKSTVSRALRKAPGYPDFPDVPRREGGQAEKIEQQSIASGAAPDSLPDGGDSATAGR